MQRHVTLHFLKVGEVMIVVAGVEFVCSRPADGDAISGVGNRLLQHPLGIVRDGVDGRVMLADQRTQARRKPSVATGIGVCRTPSSWTAISIMSDSS